MTTTSDKSNMSSPIGVEETDTPIVDKETTRRNLMLGNRTNKSETWRQYMLNKIIVDKFMNDLTTTTNQV